MTTLIFKTYDLAMQYIDETYPQVAEGKYSLIDSIVDDRCPWEAVDMPDLCWSGELAAISVLDEEFNEVARIAGWEIDCAE